MLLIRGMPRTPSVTYRDASIYKESSPNQAIAMIHRGAIIHGEPIQKCVDEEWLQKRKEGDEKSRNDDVEIVAAYA
jgi:hypothetical protein